MSASYLALSTRSRHTECQLFGHSLHSGASYLSGSCDTSVGGFWDHPRLHAAPFLGFWAVRRSRTSERNGVQNAKLWQRLLGVEHTVVDSVVFDEDQGCIVASVRPRKGAAKLRCGLCGKRCGGYDQGEGRRRWRTLDLGAVPAWLEAASPRVSCAEHGVVVAQVPWARHGAGHTRCFDDMTAWLATHCSKSAVTEVMRVAWRTVGAIAERVVDDAQARRDPLAGLTRIGIDEISYKKGHKYLVVIVDHDSGNLV